MYDPEAGFGIYIHWPFCAAKCPYCDFNSHVSQRIDHALWRTSLLADLEHQSAWIGGRKLTSVFFGGGTPSLMEPETVEVLLNRIGALFRCDKEVEVTLEANPTSVEAEKFKAFRTAGVSRISMGIQSLIDEDLKRLGRRHTSAEAIDAFTIARNTFESVSFDLIYARQNQSLASWEKELGQALSLAVDHLSLYQLTIEPMTRFGDLSRLGRLKGMPEDALAADMYEATQQLCERHGMRAYEVSNHAGAGAGMPSQPNILAGWRLSWNRSRRAWSRYDRQSAV